MAFHGAALWDTAALIRGPGDYAMTVFGVRTMGMQEGNPLMRRFPGGDPGPGSFVMLKPISIALFFAAYWTLRPAVVRLTAPFSLIAPGTIVTARDARIIHRHV